jgi:predicted HTH domain antitoxin
MPPLNVTLELPRDLLGALDVPQVGVEARLRELIALELFRERRISSGKGAELLGISKVEFVQLLARHDIDYFVESPEESAEEVAELAQMLDKTP